jgi:hypothetical protein
MSTVVIISFVALLLAIMVGVAITMQTVEKNKKEKRRLEAGLKARSRNFQHMLLGFPEGFLSTDLRALVARCLQDVNNQLAELSPKDPQSQAGKVYASQLIEQIKNEPAHTGGVQLTNAAQIKDTQKLLASLSNFVGTLAQSNRIKAEQAKAYMLQIRRLTLQTTIDGLESAAHQAASNNKAKLAVHYCTMALERLEKENRDGGLSNRIAQIKAKQESYEQELDQTEQRLAAADKEWDAINKEDDSWKKKAIYD